MKKTIPVVIEIKEDEGAVWVGDSLVAVIPLRFADLPSVLEEVRHKVAEKIALYFEEIWLSGR
ncbi:MAG: hypothetical protein DRP94_08625 [Candidatus Latescibacterota bacterium]|nr:MAG: hypothetical protein DRP94_08625 [Candidatus Latescibacterota bacterium]